QALIVHHDGHADTEAGPDETDPEMRCGCSDYRTDVDLDLGFQDDAANVFPTGLYPEEWSEKLKPDLNAAAEAIELRRIETELKEARARVRARFTAPEPAPETTPATGTETGTGTGTATEHGTTPEPEKHSAP